MKDQLIALVRAGHADQAQELCKTLGVPLDLSGADLFGADLRHANLSGANLSGADLELANLRGAIGIEEAA
jgi:uncharacterized protein YjbI with pentapeptide repeats